MAAVGAVAAEDGWWFVDMPALLSCAATLLTRTTALLSWAKLKLGNKANTQHYLIRIAF